MDNPQADLLRIMTSDPLGLTDLDIDAAVTAIRAARHTFNEGQRAPSLAKAKPGKPAAASLGLDLGDL